MSDDVRKASTVSGHRKSVAENQVTSVLRPDEVAVFDRELSADEQALAALGYKYDTTGRIRMAKILTTLPGQNSRENFHYGLLSVSHLLFSACFRPSRQPFGMEWAMLEHQVWSGVGL